MDQNEAVIEEIEALKAIFIEELDVEYTEGRPCSLSTKLYPSTADDPDQQYVCLVLTLKLPFDYPEQAPEVLISSPRGLSDEFCNSILSKCFGKCEEYKGLPVLYEVIQLVKDQLTLCNRPVGTCPICLYGFVDSDAITVTGCYHHYHCHCLGRYITACLQQFKELEKDYVEQLGKKKPENETTCAVCREPLKIDPVHLALAPPPKEAENDVLYRVGQETRQQLVWRKTMSDLYAKQKGRGGIIDTEADSTRVLLITQDREENGLLDPGNHAETSVVAGVFTNTPESNPPAPPQSSSGAHPKSPYPTNGHHRDEVHHHVRRDLGHGPRYGGGVSYRPPLSYDSGPRPRYNRPNTRPHRGPKRTFPRPTAHSSSSEKSEAVGPISSNFSSCVVDRAIPVNSLAALNLQPQEPGPSNGREGRKQARTPPGFPKR